MAQNEIYRVTWVFSDTQGPKVYTTSLYLKQVTVAGFTVGDVAAECVGVWKDGLVGNPALESYYDDSIALEEIEMRKWSPLSPTIDTSTTGLPAPGTLTSQSLPGADAMLVSVRTGSIGRSYRGRMYWPPLSESLVDSGKIPAASALEIAESFAGLAVAFQSIGVGGASNAQWVVWSDKLSIATPVTHFKVDENIRSQRRRQLRPADYQSANV